MHTGEKPCTYDVCDNLFCINSILKAHRQTKTDKNEKCKVGLSYKDVLVPFLQLNAIYIKKIAT